MSETTIPQFSELGVWKLDGAQFQDQVGNQTFHRPLFAPGYADITVVPEPSSIVMAAMALAALGWFGWRRTQQCGDRRDAEPLLVGFIRRAPRCLI